LVKYPEGRDKGKAYLLPLKRILKLIKNEFNIPKENSDAHCLVTKTECDPPTAAFFPMWHILHSDLKHTFLTSLDLIYTEF